MCALFHGYRTEREIVKRRNAISLRPHADRPGACDARVLHQDGTRRESAHFHAQFACSSAVRSQINEAQQVTRHGGTDDNGGYLHTNIYNDRERTIRIRDDTGSSNTIPDGSSVGEPRLW